MEMAVDACQHLLSKPDILSQLKAKDLELPTPPSKDLPDVTDVLAKPKKHGPLLEYDDDVPY